MTIIFIAFDPLIIQGESCEHDCLICVKTAIFVYWKEI